MARDLENAKRLKKEWYERNKALTIERSRLWALSNPNKRKDTIDKWRNDNRDQHNATNRKWNVNNKDKKAALEAKRRSAQLNRTPPGLTQDHFDQIEELYTIAKMFQMYTGQLYHVDHIIPLQGKKVSGLHAPWNLQVLHYKENLQKSNKTS